MDFDQKLLKKIKKCSSFQGPSMVPTTVKIIDSAIDGFPPLVKLEFHKKLSALNANSQTVAPPAALRRIKRDYMALKRDPIPYITAEPLPKNLLEWHYVVRGPEDTPYCGGYYHGMLHFPREFPFKPPAIYMLTPNGRFRTNTRLCLSISDFHPDTWNPTWSIGTILTGLLSFMLEKTPTLGAIDTSNYEKQQLAKKSLGFNLRNPKFREVFPEICEEIKNLMTPPQQKTQVNAAAGDIFALNDMNIDTGKGDSIETVPVNMLQRPFYDKPDRDVTVQTDNERTMQQQHFKPKKLVQWAGNAIIMLAFFLFIYIVNYVIKGA